MKQLKVSEIFYKIWFWLKNSRLFSLPMTLFSWIVIFVYSLPGNYINGLLALIGISFAHLATNLFDDYIDYKNLDDNCQKCKCAYIKQGKATINDVLMVVIIYFLIASFAGLFLYVRCGLPVIYLALIGGFISLFYAKLSKLGCSEIAVGTAFGPLFFEGVYFVMTNKFSIEVLFLSLAVVMPTIGLMFTHTVLDYEGDLKCKKMTLACRLGTKERAINGVYFVYGLGFIFTLISAYIMKNYFLIIPILLSVLVKDLHDSLKTFECGGDVSEFYKRLLKARNLMIYNSVIIAISILLSK